MTGAELIARVRLISRDTVLPYLFSDEAIASYLTEAQVKFCQYTHALVDKDNYTVTTTAGEAVYDVSPRIMAVYGAKIDGADMRLLPFSAAPQFLAYNSAIGKPTAYAMDYAFRYLTFDCVPDADYEVKLIAAVLPSSLIDDATNPVIPEEWHHLLAHYAVSQLATHVDADTMNPKLAAEQEQKWYVGVRDAKRGVYHYRTGEMVNIPRVA